MGVIYRDVRADEYDDMVDLINYAFGFQAQRSLAKAYGEGAVAPSRHKVAVDEGTGRLLAAVGVYPQSVRLGDRSLQVGFLGCVAVHPRARGEGHMRRLIDLWHEELRREGRTDMMVLWGLRHRYEHFGYTPSGYDCTYTVNDSCAKHALAGTDASGISFRPMFAPDTRQADIDLAVRLNKARIVHVDRDPRYIDRICSYLSGEALAVEYAGRTAGYLVRSVAEPGVVRELALDDPALAGAFAKAYLGELRGRGSQSFTLRVSPTDAALNERFTVFCEDTTIGNLCKCNIFDYAAVIEGYLSVAARLWHVESGRFSAVLDGQPVTVTVTGDAVSVERQADEGSPRLSKMDAQELVMGMGARYRHDLPVAPAGWFPLPLCWYWPDLN